MAQSIPPVTLDMSKAQPLSSAAPVTIDMSKAQPLQSQNSQAGLLERSGLAPQDTGNGVLGTLESVAGGINKGMAQTASGVYDLAGSALKKVLPKSLGDQIPNAGKTMGDMEAHGPAEATGKAIEDMMEWAAGDKALMDIVKVAHTPPSILKLLKEHSIASKIILDTMKGGAIGGTQGAVKHASEGKAVEGAVSGAIGGGIASGVTSAAEAGVGALGKKLGVSGMTAEEKIKRAAGGSASLKEQNLEENTKLALPRIAKENAAEPIHDAKDFAEAAHSAKQDVWSGPSGYKEMTDRHHMETVSGDDIAQEIKDHVSPTMRRFYPKTAQNIEEWADQFKGNLFLDSARDHLVELNQRMRDFYSLSKAEQFKLATANPELGMLQDATDSLRDKIDTKLFDLGEEGSAALRKEYGALSQMQRIFEKRHIVYGRQAPIDIKQSIGGIAAVASGHPLAAAIPYFTKKLNSPGYLIKSALADTIPTGGTEAAGSTLRTVGKNAKKVLETAAGVAGENWIRFRGSDGQDYEAHPEDWDAIIKADPGAKKVE